MDNNRDKFYSGLKEKLDVNMEFPCNYLYKFIMPNKEEKERSIEAIFNHMKAKITKKKSSKGTYISISILVFMQSSQEIIDVYKKVENIEGVISI